MKNNMMKSRLIVFSLMVFGTCNVFSQTTVPVDIVMLSELTFSKNPTIKRNVLNITNAKAHLQIQKSTFDYQFISDLSLSRNDFNLFDVDPRNEYINDKLKSKNLGASMEFQKKFRSGLSASLSSDYSMERNNFPFDNFNQNVGSYQEDHKVLSSFSLTQPLLRGRGKQITTALEKASYLKLESTKKNTDFANSFELFQTGSVYWQYLAAYKNLKIFQENEARVRRVYKVTQELVKADKKPASDLVQVRADLANQERQTKVAEQTLFGTRLNLGRAVGLSEVDSKQLGNPLDEFPSIIESGYVANLDRAGFLELAQNNREDIDASKKSQEALEFQLKLAKDNRKSKLDLTGFFNYGGMNVGNGIDRAVSSFTRNEGRSLGFGFTLKFSLPINNNLAKGSYIQTQVALEAQQISNENLQRNININVSVALNDLDNSVLILEKALASLNFYQEVYDNEQEKFKNGLSILLNLIQFQERLTYAQLEYLHAHQKFASAIIKLRYETGTLLVSQKKDGAKEISRKLFYTIPR